MGDHSVEGTWCDSRLEVAVWEGDVSNKRRTGIPGGLVATLLWEFASSTGSTCSEKANEQMGLSEKFRNSSSVGFGVQGGCVIMSVNIMLRG
jgi:hypothetical protein